MAISFSELWEKAEEISTANSSCQDQIFIKIATDLQEYEKLNNIPSKEIQKILKTKKMGEILFKISTLSKIDNINTYEALQIETQYHSK